MTPSDDLEMHPKCIVITQSNELKRPPALLEIDAIVAPVCGHTGWLLGLQEEEITLSYMAVASPWSRTLAIAI